MKLLERISKTAAIASVLAIVVLQLIAHPDITPLLQVLAVAAFAGGWSGGRSPRTIALWTVLLVVSPALLRLATGREGPVLDIVALAALAGALIRAVPWSRWQLPPLWSLAVGGWALTLALAWPVMIAREAGFEVDGVFNTSAITSWTLLTATQTVGWIGSVALTQLLALLWFDWVFAETAAAGRPPAAVHGLWMAVTVASIVAIVQGFVDGDFLSTAAWAGPPVRATGTMLDANAFGAAANLAGPVGFIALRAGVIRGGWPAAAVVLGLNLLGAWLSASRTTLAIAAVGLAGMGWGLMQMRQERERHSFRLAAVGTAAALVMVLLLTANSGPLRRLFEMPGGRGLGDTGAGAVATELLWRRGGYGTVAHQILREYPLTGVGIGSFHFIVADYYRVISNDDGLPFDNAQNWWRQVLAEFGLLGGAAPILWSILIACSVLRPPRAEPGAGPSDQEPRPPDVDYTLRGLLVGVGLCSLLGVPTQNVVVLFAFLAVLAWFIAPPGHRGAGGETGGRSPMEGRLALNAGGILFVVLALAYAGEHLLLAEGSLSETARAMRFQREYVGGGYALERDAEGTPFNWTDDNTTFLLPRTQPWLVLRLWADHPDLRSQPVRVTFGAQCGSFFETTLAGPERMTVGVQVPESYRAVDLKVTVSRTWRPAEHGGRDGRRLGVAIVHGFTDEAVGPVADHVVALPECETR
jgi:hypothetical protein